MIPLMYDPRPFLERAKDALNESVALATSRGEDTPKIPLDRYVDAVRVIERQVDELIELVNEAERAAA